MRPILRWRGEPDYEIPMLIRVISVATMAVIISALAARADPVDPAQAIAQKFSEASDGKQPAPAATPQKPGDDADYEADMLQRARAEELDRQKQDAQQIAVKPVAPVSPPAALPATQIPPPAPTIAALPEKPAAEPANSPAPRLARDLQQRQPLCFSSSIRAARRSGSNPIRSFASTIAAGFRTASGHPH